MNRLLHALAKSNFAISEEGVHGYFPLAQSIMRGSHVFTPQPLVDDEIIPDYDDEENDSPAVADVETGRIIVMRVTGVMLHYGGMCSYGTEDYANRINGYLADESVSGLIILADTPGGEVDGIETLREAVVNFRAQKPLITLVNDGTLASGGVWAFAASSEIYSSNTISMVGSIGVLCSMLDIRKAMEKNGIKQVVIRAPQSSDKARTYTDALDGKDAVLLAELKFICDRFFEVVKTDRGDKLTSDEWNTGKMFFAGDAQRIGLIDGIKNYPEVVARMQELIAQNQNPNTMLKRFPKVAALKGAETITAESLEAANEEIEAYGIPGVSLVLDAELEPLQAAAETIEGLNTTISAHVASIALKDTEIIALNAKVVTLQAKVDGKPAVAPTGLSAEDDSIPDTGGELDYVPTSVDLEKARLQALFAE